METIHATCIALEGRGVVLRGASGSGKSDLALRLIDCGAELVADDRVVLSVAGGRVCARAPAALRGLLEVRGLGPVRVPSLEEAPVVLVADLAPGEPVERLPDPACIDWGGVTVPRISLDPFHASAPAKLRVALSMVSPGGDAMWPVEAAPQRAKDSSHG